MLELMSQVALSVGAERRREDVYETMRAVRASNGGMRQAAGVALVGMGKWIAGESPAPARALKASGDCI